MQYKIHKSNGLANNNMHHTIHKSMGLANNNMQYTSKANVSGYFLQLRNPTSVRNVWA